MRAVTVALFVFGTAFVATLVLDPAPLASKESPARTSVAAAPCLPAKLARHGDLAAGRPAVHRLRDVREPEPGPPSLVDLPDARLVKIDTPAVEGPPDEPAPVPTMAAEAENPPSDPAAAPPAPDPIAPVQAGPVP